MGMMNDDDNGDKDDDEDGDQVVGAPKPEELLLRVLLVRFRQRGFGWSVIPCNDYNCLSQFKK